MLEIGKKAPTFSLPNQDGVVVKHSDLAGKWVVLYFYPKDDTPGCTVENTSISETMPTFKKLKAAIYGVSPDSPKRHKAFITKKGYGMDLLSDEDKKVCEKYGVWVEKSMYGRKYMGVARTTFLIDPSGKIAHIFEGVKPKEHGPEVAKKLQEMQKGA